MTFTLLTQQELDQIPHLIYKKILIEYNNAIDINAELNRKNIQKQAEINKIYLETEKLKTSMQNLNLSRSFLEIENEFYKMRVESLNKILDLLDLNENIKDHKNKTQREHTNNSTNISLVSKLIKKIKILSKKYKTEKKKYRKIFSEFAELLRARDQIYEDYSKNLIDNKLVEECVNILNKCEFIEKAYFSNLERCNHIEYEYNKLRLENKDLKYKYDRYIISNREDIIPVIGRELDAIKDKIFDFTSNCDLLDANHIFNEFWKYIDDLKHEILYHKELDKNRNIIKEEINNMHGILKIVNKEVDECSYIYSNLVREIQGINDIIQDLYKKKINNEFSIDYNYLLLEIHGYKNKIKNLESAIEEQNKIFDNFKSEVIRDRENIINEKDNLILEKKKTIIEKENIINEKDEVIRKMALLLSKLKKVKEEYISLKKSVQPE